MCQVVVGLIPTKIAMLSPPTPCTLKNRVTKLWRFLARLGPNRHRPTRITAARAVLAPAAGIKTFNQNSRTKVYIYGVSAYFLVKHFSIRPFVQKRSKTSRFGYTKLYPAIPSNTKLYQDVPSYTKLYQVIPTFTKLYQAIPSYTKLFQAIPSYTKLYQATPRCTKLYRVLPRYTKLYNPCRV